MVGLIITGIIGIFIISTILSMFFGVLDTKESFSTLGALVGIWALIMAIGSVMVYVGTNIDAQVKYSDPVEFSKVSVYDGKHIIEFEDRDPVTYDETHVKIAPPQDNSSIREGVGVGSWGHWLPFDDWDSGKYVEFTPSNK